jgi:hypothetical protein
MRNFIVENETDDIIWMIDYDVYRFEIIEEDRRYYIPLCEGLDIAQKFLETCDISKIPFITFNFYAFSSKGKKYLSSGSSLFKCYMVNVKLLKEKGINFRKDTNVADDL